MDFEVPVATLSALLLGVARATGFVLLAYFTTSAITLGIALFPSVCTYVEQPPYWRSAQFTGAPEQETGITSRSYRTYGQDASVGSCDGRRPPAGGAAARCSSP